MPPSCRGACEECKQAQPAGRYLTRLPDCDSFSPNTIRYVFNFEANLVWSVFDRNRVNAVSIPVLSRDQVSEISECWACAHRHISEMHGTNEKGAQAQGLIRKSGLHAQTATQGPLQGQCIQESSTERLWIVRHTH